MPLANGMAYAQSHDVSHTKSSGYDRRVPEAHLGTAESATVPSAATQEGSSRGFIRSRQMADCLRKELLYAEKRPRDALFHAVEQIISEQKHTAEPMILSRITREAAARARDDAQRAGFAFAQWETASKAVVKAMLCAGVLLTADGRAIPADIAAQATPVAGLRDGYQDLTEAFLLEFLIRRLGDVTTRDHRALAHVLFRQFDRRVPLEDLEDRVVILLAGLADRVELHSDTYVATARQGP